MVVCLCHSVKRLGHSLLLSSQVVSASVNNDVAWLTEDGLSDELKCIAGPGTSKFNDFMSRKELLFKNFPLESSRITISVCACVGFYSMFLCDCGGFHIRTLRLAELWLCLDGL